MIFLAVYAAVTVAGAVVVYLASRDLRHVDRLAARARHPSAHGAGHCPNCGRPVEDCLDW